MNAAENVTHDWLSRYGFKRNGEATYRKDNLVIRASRLKDDCEAGRRRVYLVFQSVDFENSSERYTLKKAIWPESLTCEEVLTVCHDFGVECEPKYLPEASPLMECFEVMHEGRWVPETVQ